MFTKPFSMCYLFSLIIIIISSGFSQQELFTRGLRYHTTLRKMKISYNKPHVCAVNFKDKRKHIDHDETLPIIYFITPSYLRPEQVPELTRLSHTLMHVPKIHWIVADDSNHCSKQVLGVLRRSCLPYTFISSPNPDLSKVPSWAIPRGVANRRAGLSWIQQTVKDGVMYFGDDDNTFDLELFNEIRKTKKLSMFPVGLVGFYGASSPVLKEGKVVGFFDSWSGRRKFPVDMAGFAINIKHLKRNAKAMMPFKTGFLEDIFLTSLDFSIDDIEPLAENCTKVLVWHTRSQKYGQAKLRADINQLVKAKYDSLAALLREVSKMGIVKLDPDGINAAVIFSFRSRNKYKYLTDL